MPGTFVAKGHWPAGKRRNPDGGQWSRLRLSLTSLVVDNFRPTVRSAAVVAAALGVNDRTVRRWISGVDVPSAETQELLQVWCRDARRALKRER